MTECFITLATYNRWANTRLLEDLIAADDEALLATETVNFGSIMGILNHLLLGDQLWLARFTGQGSAIPSLSDIPFPKLDAFAQARAQEDQRILDFVATLTPAGLRQELRYTNTKNIPFVRPLALCLSHFFNHQTHHRGQVHALMGRYGLSPRDIDLIFCPLGE